MHTQDCVVGLDHGSSHLRAAPHGEGDLALLPIVHRQTLEHEAAQAGSCASSTSVVDAEPLKTGAVVRKLSDSVKDQINDLFPDRIMSTSKVVGCVFLAGNKLFRVEKLPIRPCAHFIHDCRLQINHHTAGHVFASTGLAEEGIECVVATADRLVRGHLSIGLDAVLEAEELPASIADLHAALTDVDADGLTHGLELKGVASHLVM
mmetsp:Transcript_15020/g.35469  ORF Transcript_15020/g.35469 Transcript_15020/m.35469 type:complete len:206 (+) Transcript_15020:856-1473(+)